MRVLQLGLSWLRGCVQSFIPSLLQRLDCHCIFARTGSKSVLKLEIFLFPEMKFIIHFLKM